jgi:aminomethyltransferase
MVPLPTPFHPRTSALCTSLRWKEWAGYHAVCSYDTSHEPEYHAVRNAAGLLDVTPLYKFSVSGSDATEFLCYVSARDIAKLKVGQVGYGCWCDEDGKVLDDGTVTRWDDNAYRLTSADPSFAWLSRHARGFDVTIKDVSTELAALALQGPTARAILDDACDGDVASLRYFRAMTTRLAGVEVDITRTGYTGDLGYEVWIPAEHALTVYDALSESGRSHGMLPLGLDALDVCRIEAGFILVGVDYFSARRCLIEAQKSSPYEIGLGWTVHNKRDAFIGQQALIAEKRAGSTWALVGLEIDWEELEQLFDSHGLPPQLPTSAWRTAVPVHLPGHATDSAGQRQVGRATSGAWSPLLKQNLALASVQARHSSPGTRLTIEVTVEFERKHVSATVVKTPVFDPERKRATPAAEHA